MKRQDEDPRREEYPTTVSKERRMEPRHPARREAVLYCSGIGEAVVVTNISEHGAMLVGRNLPPSGTFVTLTVAGHDLAATTSWIGEEKCGLMFHERIDPASFAEVSSDVEQQAGRPDRSSHI